MRLEKEKLKIELEFGEKIFYCRWTSIINNILIQQNFETEPDNSDLEGVEGPLKEVNDLTQNPENSLFYNPQHFQVTSGQKAKENS